MNQQLVLVCQDYGLIDSPFHNTKQIELGADTYNRCRMLNLGVLHTEGEVIVLLDSDRILPANYFTEAINSIQGGECLTTLRLYSVTKDCTDDDIETGYVPLKEDFRSVNVAPRKKNMFAGNTIMWRNDFLRLDGFDEQFEGYGFADNDMTLRASKLLQLRYSNHMELHLHHPREIVWRGRSLTHEQFKVVSAINAGRLLRKHGTFDPAICDLVHEAHEILQNQPQELVAEWAPLLGRLF